MGTIETKYAIGDKVWVARTTTETKKHPCPDCLGKKKWEAISPAGVKYEFDCPRCAARYNGDREASLVYTAYTPVTEILTIGSFRIDTTDENPISYMCRETGVGSGTIWYEKKLFSTKEEALIAAQAEADENNSKVKWVVEQYRESLFVSDYQLKEAVEVVREKEARDAVYKFQRLIEDIGYAASLDEVRDLISPKEKAA